METARFPDWSIVDFRNFYKSYLQNDDLDKISSNMTSKTQLMKISWLSSVGSSQEK